MNRIKVGVIGVGYLGNFHAQKYLLLDEAELVGVADADQGRASNIAEELGVKAFDSYEGLVDEVDAMSIVVSTQAHFEVAQYCLQHGVHVLVEKPITVTVTEAEQLITLAKQKQLTLQVGHLERFNAAVMALADHLDNPRFIESTRIAPFNLRGSDVNVMLDLMIHDIDIIQSIVHSPIRSIDANGARVLSDRADIANARITFENDCVANVTASRVSLKSERRMRVFQRSGYFSIDLQNRRLAIFEKGDGEMFPGIPNIKNESFSYEEDDALYAEIKAFLHSVATGEEPVVTGVDGKNSLEVAIKITELIRSKADF